MDMGKTVYSWLIMRDRNIEGTIVRSGMIPEELGRIEYLFSDKTGTLTRNEMEFKRLHMGTLSYNPETMDEIKKTLEMVFDPKAANELNRGYRRSRDITTRIRDIAITLAVCHNVCNLHLYGLSVLFKTLTFFD